ncbi:hypothetical protein SAMN05443247_07914 [Bradyrhizobium erythrophlei]|nr:hypothetical protein SAMN05443247_07914 [Bradyrhizobium erythrophlei]
MPALKNVKHEQFVQLIGRSARHGWTQGECYQRAGFRSGGHGAEVNASKLLKRTDIRARLGELSAPAFKKSQITVESLLAELEANIVGATVSGQHGAVNGAVALMGKLRGLLIDRVEVGGVDEFANLGSVADVAERLLGETEPGKLIELLDDLRDEVMRQAADRATRVDETPPLAPRLGDEFERSLALFRAEKGKRSR